jgi:hypothetical protein
MKRYLLPLFLISETAAYLLILTGTCRWVYFGSILLCFVFALIENRDRLIVAGLAFTVVADFFLVVCDPIRQLAAMVSFLGVQTLYGLRLHKLRPDRRFLFGRLGLIALGEGIALLVLKEGMDLLAAVSLAYYAMLILNLLQALCQRRWHFSLGLVLFLLCDTVIGLQVATDAYLHTQALQKLLYPGFNLAWLFYLPSQVLIATDKKTNP